MNVLTLFISILQHLFTALKIKIFQKRFRTIRLFGYKPVLERKEKILVVITHVVPGADTLGPSDTMEKLLRFVNTLDALMDSLSAYEVRFLVNTLPGMHLTKELPAYFQDRLEICYAQQTDPMMVEYDAFELFRSHSGQYDYYLFSEDDIVVTDPWFVEKIKLFNELSSDKRFVLLPHRYEMIEGQKFLLDQEIFYGEQMSTYAVNSLFDLRIGDFTFQEFENPHAAIYLLNQQQLQKWIDSGNKWKNKVVAFGALESAATYSLYENFTFLKPSLAHSGFLQVKHWGTKYASRFYKK